MNYNPHNYDDLPFDALEFHFGDILEIKDMRDENWWLATKIVEKISAVQGMIPSIQRLQNEKLSRNQSTKLEEDLFTDFCQVIFPYIMVNLMNLKLPATNKLPPGNF